MTDTSVVCSASVYVGRHTNFTTAKPKSTSKYSGRDSSSNGGLVTTFSGLVGVRDRLEAEGFADEASISMPEGKDPQRLMIQPGKSGVCGVNGVWIPLSVMRDII